MRAKPWRVVLDTNIWIDFLISKKQALLDKHLQSGAVVLLFSEELLDEFLEVIKRPRFHSLFSAKDANQLLKGLSRYSLMVQTNSKVVICRDPKDNFLLELCIDGKATHLITGDADLLTLKQYQHTIITSLPELLQQLEKSK